MEKLVYKPAVEQSYSDVERWVNKLIWTFQRKYNLDIDDVRSVAFEAYADCFHSYDPDLGEFTTWVGTKVWGRLMDHLRKVITERKRFTNDVDLDLCYRPEPRKFDLEELKGKLSEEGQEMLNLVFDAPIDIRFILRRLGGESPQNFRAAIREFLRDMGWAKTKIKETFYEIRRAL